MKWYKHLLLYIVSVIFTEIVLVLFFLFGMALIGNDIWNYFSVVQIALPFASLLPFFIVEISIDVDEKNKKEEIWYKRVNTMLKDYEKKGENL